MLVFELLKGVLMLLFKMTESLINLLTGARDFFDRQIAEVEDAEK
jgi:hypothetical protein